MVTMTTVRSTPNLTIAATQNTAPVYEFRCLYTHDVRKKKKVWHDGSLRYHTFNKRVMVYDDSKNYIGDSHWRDAEELGDGTELKLDKGVLVDVGERIGETQTDLTPLLEKRGNEVGSSPPRPPLRSISLATTSRIAAGNSQAPPKSLVDVLGISQGPIGRARFPPHSPYEHLHRPPVQTSDPEQPPTKRLRIGSDKENARPRQDKVDGGERLPRSNAIPPEGRYDTSKSSTLQDRARATSLKQVIDISSEDEPIQLLSSSPRPSTSVETNSRKASDNGRVKHVPAKTVMPPPRRLSKQKPATSTKEKAVQPKLQASEPVTVPPVTSVEKSTRSSLSTSSSKTKLRLATHKPRNKLTYRDLVRGKNGKLELRTEITPSTTRERLGEDRPSSRTKDGNARPTNPHAFSDFPGGGDDRGVSVENTTLTNELRRNKHDVDRDLAEVFTQTSSPVFMPDSPAQGALEVQGLEIIDGTRLRPAATSPPTSPSPSHIGAALVKTPVLNKPTPPLNKPTPPPLFSKLTLMDMQLMMPLSKQSERFSDAERPVTQPRSLRRVLSENNSTGYQSPDAAMKSVDHARPEAMSPASSKTTNQRPFKSPIKLTKSLSDTAARPKMHTLPAVSIAEEDTAQDCGPWSKVESYLLFDWCPPSRARLMLQDQEQSCSGMIVGKGGLLSDQVDAL